MKTVGILTMHKVVNYGSALQAWATQEVVRKLGYKAYLIDYVYPNDYHKSFKKKDYLQEVKRFCLHLYLGFPLRKKRKAFEDFWKEHYCLSKCFHSRNEIESSPPIYDLYIAGSDQIWNPNGIHEDGTFFLDFAARGKKKISYASSFAQSKLNGTFEELATKLLKDFSAISVREKNGAHIIKNLLGKQADICLDPTLLLPPQDYAMLANESRVKIKQPYMLVYILQYAYNPYPYATKFIQEAYRQTGLHVVCLDFSAKQHLGIKRSTHLHDAVGPAEFVWLFANASLVITTSFHGTAFSINFNIPFYSILDNQSSKDDRMKSLLDCCGLNDRGIVKNSKISDINLSIDKNKINQYLNLEREKSINYLVKNLK